MLIIQLQWPSREQQLPHTKETTQRWNEDQKKNERGGSDDDDDDHDKMLDTGVKLQIQYQFLQSNWVIIIKLRKFSNENIKIAPIY